MPIRVIIVWTFDKSINSLSYGHGLVRSYPKDEYDPRCVPIDGKLPFFQSEKTLAKHFAKHKGMDSLCQIPANLAINIGLHQRNDIDWE